MHLTFTCIIIKIPFEIWNRKAFNEYRLSILLFRFTYEIAPVFTLMEEVVLQRMLSMIGWPQGDALFSPGM